MDITDRIKEKLKEKNTSLAAAERELNFGNGTITRWAKNSPSVDKVVAVAEYLDVTVEWLITGNGPEKQTYSEMLASKHIYEVDYDISYLNDIFFRIYKIWGTTQSTKNKYINFLENIFISLDKLTFILKTNMIFSKTISQTESKKIQVEKDNVLSTISSEVSKLLQYIDEHKQE